MSPAREASGRGGLSLRVAGSGDRDLLLAWANDAETRAASFHPDQIDRATHTEWFEHRLAKSDGRIWIGLVDGVPIGQLRVDRDAEGRGEVSISVAEEARGRGFARGLLLAGMAAAARELGVTTFVALVRPENARSLALFRGAGFRDEADGERNGIACRIMVRDGEVEIDQSS
jgi:RimJ/RimL family protein N-acetyltransferase